MTFAVSIPAATTALAALATLKAELGITGTGDDTFLATKIEQKSAQVCVWLGVAAADDGTRTLGRETLVETVRHGGGGPLILARRPIVSVTSVVEDGVTLAATDYEADKMTGLLTRLSGDEPIWWASGNVVVTYTAGWLLPGDANRNLPQDIEDAVIGLVKGEWFARGRDPMVKSEDIPGVMRTDYWVTGETAGMPREVGDMLAPHRNVVLG